MKTTPLCLLICATIIIAPLTGCSIGKRAQEGIYGKKVAWYSQFFSPEKDLYAPLVLKPITLLNETSYDFAYKHKYSGTYNFSFLLPKMKKMEALDKTACDFQLLMIFKSDEHNLFSKKIDCCEDFRAFYGSKGNGIILCRYSIPENLPVDKLVQCNIVISKPGPKFVELYGEPTIEISKMCVE